MKPVDLMRLLGPEDAGRGHSSVRSTRVLAPKIHYPASDGEGVQVVCDAYGCTRLDLPDGEGWSSETGEIASHMGANLDAPPHLPPLRQASGHARHSLDGPPSAAGLRELAPDRWRAARLSLRENRIAGAIRVGVELYGCGTGDETVFF